MKIATNAFLDGNNRFFYHHFKGICRYLPTFQQLKSSKYNLLRRDKSLNLIFVRKV